MSFCRKIDKRPEIRYTNSETPVTVVNYTMAVDRKYSRADEPKADFLNFVGYGSSAEFAEKYLRKGIKMIVTARCQTRSYTNKEDKRVNITEFIIEDQEFAKSKRAAEGEPAAGGNDFMQISDGEQDKLPFD